MTRDEAIALLPTFIAFTEGAQIECRNRSDGPDAEWHDITDPSFTARYKYRAKATPKLRPWTAEEMPKVLAVTDILSGQHFLIEDGKDWHTETVVDPETLLRNYMRLNADGTESPCGVMEAGT